MINHQSRMQHKTFVLTESDSSFAYLNSMLKLEQPIRIFDRSLMCGLGRGNASLIVYLARTPRVNEEEMVMFAKAHDFPIFMITDVL
jgi:hypothetical protein